jgi:hypothetical protein
VAPQERDEIPAHVPRFRVRKLTIDASELVHVLYADDTRRVAQFLLASCGHVFGSAADRCIARPSAVATRGTHQDYVDPACEAPARQPGSGEALVIGMGKAEEERAPHSIGVHDRLPAASATGAR